jgi:phenylacetate-CoA ligase
MLRRAACSLALRLAGQTHKNIRELSRWAALDDGGARDLQRARLRALLVHAYENVPYYNQLFAGIGLVDERLEVNLDRFGAIPLLERSVLSGARQDLLSGDLAGRRWGYNSSGGSTGEPVTVVQDKEYLEWSRAGKIFFDRWTGRMISDRKVVLWGSERDIKGAHESVGKRMVRVLNGELYLSAYQMSPKNMEKYLEEINAFEPVQILAYAESIYELAKFAEERGIGVRAPLAIMTSAGVLGKEMREKIEGVFGAPVFDRYGCREMSDIACECSHHDGMHVLAPIQYVEIVNEAGVQCPPGERGRIVVTSLTNYAMPLIRYVVGDEGSWADGPCACGCPWPRIGEVHGRITDNFVSVDNTLVYGGAFRQLLNAKAWVRKYQIIQETVEKVEIYVVTHTGSVGEKERADLVEIEESTRRMLGKNCFVGIHIVEEIMPSPSGKHVFTMSKVRVQDGSQQNTRPSAS